MGKYLFVQLVALNVPQYATSCIIGDIGVSTCFFGCTLAAMSLPHALLTALTEKPYSGSDLALRFDRSIGYFWYATHQQIYRELARLEAEGMIESLPEQSSRGRKRAYRILPPGRKELKKWTVETHSPSPLRDEVMVRLWAEAAIGPTRLDQILARRLMEHQAKLETFLAFEARDFSSPPVEREAALRHVVLQAGIEHERYWIEMLNRALSALKLPKSEQRGS